MNRPFSNFLHPGLWTLMLIFLTLSSCKNECKDTECFNGGICDEGTCLCPEDYTGNQCEYMAVSALYGEYTCGVECTESQNEQPIISTILITASPSGGNNVIISIGQFPLNGSFSGNTLIFEDYYYEYEDFEGNVVGHESVTAEGTISDGILYIHYESEYQQFGSEFVSTCELACPIKL